MVTEPGGLVVEATVHADHEVSFIKDLHHCANTDVAQLKGINDLEFHPHTERLV